MKTKFLQRVMWLMIPLLTIFTTNVWGESVTFTFNTDAGLTALGITKPGTGAGTDLTANSNYTISPISFSTTHGNTNTRVWNSSGTTSLRVYKNTNSKTNYGTLTFTSSSGNITAISLGSGTWNASTGTMDGTSWSGNAASVTLSCTANATISTITVTYTAATTTVTASPTSITFAANTLSGDGAEGSSTINISVSNGYKSSGNYLNIWPETDETSCEFYVNSGNYIFSSGNSTSVSSLSVEYYAIEAGTFTGNLIAEGYNSSYEAVRCTIPLSITVSAPACANNVTINKGTSTNCSFTLSKSGAQASCDGVSTTVTVSPTSGYGNPSVTQSGASAAPTITGSGTSWTVSYGNNTTGTSTINVSCSANNYTITLDKDLTPTTAGTASITATYNSSSNLTSAITKPTKDGWTFAGYFTAKNGGGTQIIDASGNVIASAGGGSTYTDGSKNWKYAGNITLYAKWTCTVTWSVNGLTNVYSTQTVTYNSSGSKVASVPGPPSPASYCGDKFVGWTTQANVSQDDDTGLNLFTTVADSPELKTVGDQTFYAVFADYDD